MVNPNATTENVINEKTINEAREDSIKKNLETVTENLQAISNRVKQLRGILNDNEKRCHLSRSIIDKMNIELSKFSNILIETDIAAEAVLQQFNQQSQNSVNEKSEVANHEKSLETVMTPYFRRDFCTKFDPLFFSSDGLHIIYYIIILRGPLKFVFLLIFIWRSLTILFI